MYTHCLAQVWVSNSSHSHLHDSCVLWALLLISSTSPLTSSLSSLITLLFLLPDTFNFHDVVDKYPAYFRWGPWHLGRERASYTETTKWSSKRTTSLTKCAKQHCSKWLPKPRSRTGWLGEESLTTARKSAAWSMTWSGTTEKRGEPSIWVEEAINRRRTSTTWSSERWRGLRGRSERRREWHQLRPSLAESLSAIVETLNSASMGKSKGKGKKGQWTQESSHGRPVAGHIAACGGEPPAVAAAKRGGRAFERPKGKGKGKGKSGGKAMGKGEGIKRRPEGLDTPRGRALADDGLTTWSRTRLKEKTPKKKAAGLKKTTRLSNWGILAAILVWWARHQDCVMHSEAGWTAVTRKPRNRQQCSRRHGCCEKSGTVLGSLWDNDNDVFLGQVADDRTRKGMVKISAVVDSGAEANALPEHMM